VTASVATQTDGFISKHGIWNDEQHQAAAELRQRIELDQIRQVRIGWPDQHGIVRGKTLVAEDFLGSLEDGRDMQSAILIMDTTNNPIVPFFAPEGGLGIPEIEGMADVVLVPDVSTFRRLPWVKDTGWILSDMYYTNGAEVGLSTRNVFKRALANLASLGFDYLAGLEVEFYITKLEDPQLSPEASGYPPDPPLVSTIAHGFQYLTESRNDEIDHILQPLHDALISLGLPLRSMEDEWGPGQCEFTFGASDGLTAADNMILFRTAVKQICRRLGYHATFMSRPGLPNFFSSGWHLHQSLVHRESGGGNAFVSDDAHHLSGIGQNFAAGLLEHAPACCLFTTPTVNGYKRFKPHSLAPINVSWTFENRGSLLRIIGQPGDLHTHIENRAGEPAANPYLYMASQVIAGTDGITRELPLEEPTTGDPYVAEKPPLPRNLYEAIAALDESTLFRGVLGDGFVDYITRLKRFEMDRYMSTVTDWEHREYFDVF
jgi:glutamine synthetase